MDLKNFPFPQGIRLAGPKDNPAILDFYSRSALAGQSLRLRSDRGPDFFGFLKYQSDRSDVLLYEDSKGITSGIGTICYRKGYIGGQIREVGYLGDFRVAFSRPVIRVWRKFYGDILKYLSNPEAIPMLTAVIDENQAATNALVQRENKYFSYQLLTPYRMINILKRLPFSGRKALGLSVRRATPVDQPVIEKFLDRQSRAHAFGYCFSEGELERRLANWTGFHITDFYLAFESGELVGCVALWSPSEAKRNILEKMPFHYQLYRPLIHMPKIGQALKSVYLTHVEVQKDLTKARRAQVFRLLVDSIEWPRSAHMLSFCDFSHNRFADSLGGYILNRVPMKLFTVAATGQSRVSPKFSPHFSGEEMREPGFEIALV